MSLFNALTTSVSGMAAQAQKLTTIADNVANVNTTGYKRVSTQFESLLNHFSETNFDDGGVATRVRYNISEQGDLTAGTSATDLAIAGAGFFLVTDGAGATYLTRAGSFRQDSLGNLVNSAGFTLMGYRLASGATSADGLGKLTPVNVLTNELEASPSTRGIFTANLDSRAEAISGSLPSGNTLPVKYTSKSSLLTYDNLGNAVTLDVYFSKTGSNTWEISIYNAADATAGTIFPYASAALTTQKLAFSPDNGKLEDPRSLSVTIPGGRAMTIDLASMTQLASDFAVTAATTDGHAPSELQQVGVTEDGVLVGIYANGYEVPLYRIPLATVPSVDNLRPVAGDAFRASIESGNILVGIAGSSGLGAIRSSRLEASTVDLASELTDMIVAQRGYESNTKVFQTGSELLGYLTNMLK